MQKDTFNQLCIRLRRAGLKDSRYILIDQQVVMFLWVLNYSASIQATAERFNIPRRPLAGKACKLSDSIIYVLIVIHLYYYSYFHEVLQAIITLYKEVITLPTAETRNPSCLAHCDRQKYKTFSPIVSVRSMELTSMYIFADILLGGSSEPSGALR